MKSLHIVLRGVFVAISVTVAAPAIAAPIFFGPVPYLSTADIPVGFYAGGAPVGLENFEDGSLDFGITASAGGVIAPGSITDSVDADDGSIDGSGTGGRSFFSGSGATGITFTFAVPVKAAGVVWTDGLGTTTFEAFGLGGVSLGSIGPVSIADGSFSGTTAEDRFFGVQELAGITEIKISNTSGGIEVDHLQFGDALDTGPGPGLVPAPGTLVLLAAGLVGLGARRRGS